MSGFDATGRPLEAPQPQLPVGPGSGVLGRRIVAALIDLVVLGVLFVVVGLITGGAHTEEAQSVADSDVHQTNVGVSLGGAAFLLFVVLSLAYYFVLESCFGQTAGKRAMGLRVVNLGGGAATSGQVFARTLGRIVDVLPALYLLGFLVMVSGRPNRRIGDRIAGTTVVSG